MKSERLSGWMTALKGWAAKQPRVSIAAGAFALLLVAWGLYVPKILAIRKDAARCSVLREEMKETRRLLDLARGGQLRMVPSHDSVPSVLRELGAQAKECKVGLLEITPGSTGGPDSGSMPVELHLEGEYRAIGEFLGRLHEAPSLGVITVKSLRIGREERLLPRLRARLSIEVALRPGGPDGG